MKISKEKARRKRKKRIQKKIRGTSEMPRLVVFRSNRHIYAQLVDDTAGQTRCAASTLNMTGVDGLNKESAKMVGQEIAAKSKEYSFEKIVFDRNGYKYHGLVKALADGAREGGLKF